MPHVKDIVEGKPLRCPLHPVIVHFPLAGFSLGFALDIASWIAPRPELYFVRTAFIALAAGVVAAVLAAAVGFVDYSDIRNDHPAKKTATWHMVLNLVAVGLFAVSLGLRYESLDAARTPGLPFVLGGLGFVVVMFSGYLGGVLIYNDGIAVGRHRRRTPTPETTLDAPPGPAGTHLVRGLSELRPGEIARVNAGGTIAAVANLGGRLCAFQEFCTHRYGPLSEGTLENGRVVCPWHGSKFDACTGRVAHGPAKLDLRTFPVEPHDDIPALRLPPQPPAAS